MLFDTMVAQQLLEAAATPPHGGEGRPRYGLEFVAERVLSVRLDKTPQTSDWSGTLSSQQVEYARKDAAILLALHEMQAPAIREAGMDSVWQIEQRCVPAVAWTELAGVPIDREGWLDVAAQAVLDQEQAQAALDHYVGERLDVEAWYGRLRAWGHKRAATYQQTLPDWASPVQVRAALWALGHPVEDTEEPTLAALQDAQLRSLLLRLRQAERRVTTYGLDYLREINPATGRIHCSLHQLGTRTGRVAATGPNLQQVPHVDAYRSKFREPPDSGRVFIKADYSQNQLRILAEVAGDAVMKERFRKGVDSHSRIVTLLFGIPPDEMTKQERNKGKAVNFGFAFGQQPKGFIGYAKSEYNVSFTEEEAKAAQQVFWQENPGIAAWQRQFRDPFGAPPNPVETRSVLGRRRMGVWKYPEKLNSGIQGSEADGAKLAMALMYERRAEAPDVGVVLMIHDELLVSCDVATAERAKAFVVSCMREGMGAVLKELDPAVEAEVFLDWGVTPLIAPRQDEAALDEDIPPI
jgi:DNA polymerase-1